MFRTIHLFSNTYSVTPRGLFQALVGPGLLFLPAGVKNAGLGSAIILSALVGLLSTYSMLLVADTVKTLRRQGIPADGFGDIGEACYGQKGRFAVEAAIGLSQLGFCTAYLVFIAENTQAILFEINGGAVGEGGAAGTFACSLPPVLANSDLVYYIILAVVPLLVPLTWVRQMRYFAVTNLIANVLILLSVSWWWP